MNTLIKEDLVFLQKIFKNTKHPIALEKLDSIEKYINNILEQNNSLHMNSNGVSQRYLDEMLTKIAIKTS